MIVQKPNGLVISQVKDTLKKNRQSWPFLGAGLTLVNVKLMIIITNNDQNTEHNINLTKEEQITPLLMIICEGSFNFWFLICYY